MENKIILKIRSGSHLYGLNVPESDEDFIGIYLNNLDEAFGLTSSEVIDESIKSKGTNNKNTKDAVDCKFYELRKFCQLALGSNPTMLEVLFVNDENVIEIDDFGKRLIENKKLFLSTKAKHSYLGYAFSQKKKSQVKSENLKKLILAKKFLVRKTQVSMLYDNICVKKKLEWFDVSGYPSFIAIGDLKFENQKVKDVIKKIDRRIEGGTHRADGMLLHGLDYKFVSHTLRLIKEGQELLSSGCISFPLKDKELLTNVKLGKISPIEVMEIIEQEEKKVESCFNNSVLPVKPDFDGVNELVVGIYKDYFKIK